MFVCADPIALAELLASKTTRSCLKSNYCHAKAQRRKEESIDFKTLRRCVIFLSKTFETASFFKITKST
jgi:hypothetical protein